MALGFGTQPVSALQSLAAGQDVYARDILQGANRQRQMTQAQAQGDVRGLIGQGANPFAAQRQAGRQRFQAQAQNTVATNNALGQRFNTLNQQADQERIAQEARGRQMLGSMLQTAGSVASLIPGVGTAVGGGAQAVGGMLGGGGGGGIGGAVQGLMGSLSGQPQQASPAPTGATAASLMGAQPQPMMQGAGAAANQARRPGPIPGTFMADDGVNLEIPGLGRTRSLAVGPDWLAEEQRRMRAAGQYQRPSVPQFPGTGERL